MIIHENSWLFSMIHDMLWHLKTIHYNEEWSCLKKIRQFMTIHYNCGKFMTIFEISWQLMAIPDHSWWFIKVMINWLINWLYLTNHDHLWLIMAIKHNKSLCMTMNEDPWQFITLYDYSLCFMTVDYNLWQFMTIMTINDNWWQIRKRRRRKTLGVAAQ